MYCGRKKTNKLPVHPYRPVSWLPTHQGKIYIVGGKRQINYQFIPTDLFRICVYIYIYGLTSILAQHCTDEAQKAEIVLSAVSYIYIVSYIV